MNDPLSGKRPGSRRYSVSAQKARRDGHVWVGERDAKGTPILEDDAVGIDFICRNGHGILGQFRMSTMPGSARTVFTYALPDGTTPSDQGRPQGKQKALLMCNKCPTDRQITEAKIEEALNELWKPNSRRVVSYEV
ncbi:MULTISPECIES: hypothetical protein [unclassified Cryobacterium]|uniref:hypothetical protein n=1 Tax=unclassified Cryobacterium TaxID=2649013 RepID=UPI002B231120|nr:MULTISPECIES: hypothetical protein [unclassified Cryobacterium]MEA9997841.1 hypothetical protein [Cryobacterium sp. RTS3]MEB0264360.1 hypothetical protein [Cryobacterium sp. 10I5]